MEFSTIITIVVYALMFRLTLGSILLTITKLLFGKERIGSSVAFDKYLDRNSAYKMVMTLSYVIVINVVRSLDYPVLQSLLLVGMLVLIDFSVFLYYELPSCGYSELKNDLGHYRWLVV